ncbi:type III-B CRISPR module RAMP protein Cmr4 [Desulfoplanes sp. PS50]|jgi:CRISPR-associated protein Cmr4
MLFDKNNVSMCVLYGVTPLHAGSGQATGVVDLPIQRERHTGWPMVQASGVKGAFRDWFTRYFAANQDSKFQGDQARKLDDIVFGKEEKSGDSGHAGAISVSDARLLLFPVRSNVAPFVWLTCPAILQRLKRDMKIMEEQDDFEIPEPTGDDAIFLTPGIDKQEIVLEDLAVSQKQQALGAVTALIGKLAPQATRVLLVTDNNFKFLVETATEVQPQIRIKEDTGTTQDGSLRYQELLPSDSVLYVMTFFTSERTAESKMQADMIKECVKDALSSHVQMGGDMTMGRGIMEINWFTATA